MSLLLPEQLNAQANRPTQRPPSLGWTIITRPQSDAESFAASLREIWGIVASWGRWCDERMGGWPSSEDCLGALPAFLTDRIRSTVALPDWFADLHDREWIVWSIAVCGRQVKVDLSSDGLPLSALPLIQVMEALGAETSRSNLWIHPSELGAPPI